MSNAGVVRVGTEDILLEVAQAEDGKPGNKHNRYSGDTQPAKNYWMTRQISCLLTIDEGNPDKVTEGQHETEAIVDDIDRGENSRLHPQSVEDVNTLRNGDDDCM